MIVAKILQPRRGRRLWIGYIGSVLLVLILGLLQTSVFPSFAIVGIRPALVLMSAITLATISDDARALYWGFAGGLLIDLLSTTPLGVNALLFTLLVYIVGGKGRRFDRVNPMFPVLAGIAATLLYYPALILALQLLEFDIDWGRQVWNRLPRAVAVNAGATMLLYPVVRRIEQWTYPHSRARFLGRPVGGYPG
ncbi:MAG: rod shape-determining protein MreD [Chloroflexota bacterium]|nr:rod shape-determining protein MreD [Chloroflexota bacterium]MDE2919757.1 rod shape-determining protein MreD [Chloroflexota bacterium]